MALFALDLYGLLKARVRMTILGLCRAQGLKRLCFDRPTEQPA